MSAYDDMAVDVPEGLHGEVTVERLEVHLDLQNMMLGGRSCRPGTYTCLRRRGVLWMSDTTAERYDHLGAAYEIARRGGNVLIGGLGLGMLLRATLLTPGVSCVDVVEIDPDVVALVGPHYQAMALERGIELVIHCADIFQMKWPPNTHWNVVWLDIWADLCTDNLREMGHLRRSYGRRADWCDCWGRELLVYRRRQEQRAGWA